MTGMDIRTGRAISGVEHLAQSIGVLLTTPIGSLPLLRAYGCRNPDLLDAPATPATALLLRTASLEALAIWEPRLLDAEVTVEPEEAGMACTVTGTYAETGEAFSARVSGRSYSESYGPSYS